MWEKVKASLVKAINVLVGLGRLVPRKLLVLIATAALAAIKVKHPEWVLPDADFLVDVALAFLACHTVTDVANIAATAFTEYAGGRYGRGANGAPRGGRNGG